MAANWSELLPDMLIAIAEKIISENLKDFVMFSCVCSTWYRAAANVKSTIVLHHQMPWLLLPDDYHGNNSINCGDGKRNLFDLHNNKCYYLSLPETLNERCYGTGSEWIFMVGFDCTIHLYNPLTRTLFPLPSYHTFPHPPAHRDSHELDIDDDDYFDKGDWFLYSFIERVFVVNLTNNKLVVVVIYGEFNYAALAMVEDTKWTTIIDVNNKALDVCGVCDVAYSPTLGLMLFLHVVGRVKSCDMCHLNDSNGSLVPLRLVDYIPIPNFISEEPYTLGKKFYMLESFGDILLVRRTYHEQTNVTYDFKVYKLDLHAKEWKEVLNLGDVVLFLGNSPSTSVKASNFSASCKPNTIYFNDDGLRSFGWGDSFDYDGNPIFTLGGNDMGTFNLTNRTIEPYYYGDDFLSEYSVPTWFMPKL